jgi:hypothetical protein
MHVSTWSPAPTVELLCIVNILGQFNICIYIHTHTHTHTHIMCVYICESGHILPTKIFNLNSYHHLPQTKLHPTRVSTGTELATCAYMSNR